MTDEDTYSDLSTKSFGEGYKKGKVDGFEEANNENNDMIISVIDEIKNKFAILIEQYDDIIILSVKFAEEIEEIKKSFK